MTRRRARAPAAAAWAAFALAACDVGPRTLPDMALYADGLDSPRSVAPQPGVRFDPTQSSDGRGSLRIEAPGERSETLLADVPIDAPKLPRLSYRARLRSENVAGRAYLELRVRLKGGGEGVARALHAPLSGTSEWSTHEASHYLADGREASRAQLLVVIEGSGTVWVDAVTLRAGKD